MANAKAFSNEATSSPPIYFPLLKTLIKAFSISSPISEICSSRLKGGIWILFRLTSNDKN